MRALVFLGLFVFVIPVRADRAALDRDARAKFLQFNLFSDGRGMHLSPGLITYFNEVMSKLPSPGNRKLDMRSWLTRRWGLNFEGKEVVGLFTKDYRSLKVGAVGCVACHSARAAGQLVVGLGNKNIDVVRLATDAYRLESWWKKHVSPAKKNAAYVEVEEDALSFARYLGDTRIGNLSQGLVPVSFIRGWFYRVHGEEVPAEMRRGQVKVPFLWGYEEKRKVGLFCDGYGDPSEAGWAAAVELAAGQKAETVRAYYPRVLEAEELFHHFLPPKYPFPVNRALAVKGKQLFNRTCTHCHGTYESDSNGYPIFQQPRFIPWTVVRTDDDRILGNTPAFDAIVERSPLRDLIKHTDFGPGYFAPRLEGVWARFPYLHNNSVPNIAALLTKPENRPKVFSLRDAGERSRFDSGALGLTLPKTKLEEQILLGQAKNGRRSVYFVEREGHSSQGHDFYTNLTDEEKRSLIEYLKTL